jgi:hypothetical protein
VGVKSLMFLMIAMAVLTPADVTAVSGMYRVLSRRAEPATPPAADIAAAPPSFRARLEHNDAPVHFVQPQHPIAPEGAA